MAKICRNMQSFYYVVHLKEALDSSTICFSGFHFNTMKKFNCLTLSRPFIYVTYYGIAI